MQDTALFSKDFKTTPYWWETARPAEFRATELPPEADVLVIGAGYTGLNAALQTAREGLSTLVIDAEAAGWGCSTRNGGQVSTSIKPGFQTLARRYGEAVATALLEEGQASRDYLARLVADEQFDCEFREVGRFHGAHLPKLYEKLASECRTPHPVWRTDAYMVPKAEMAAELGTVAYSGGIVFPHHCSIDAGKYHAALLARVLAVGARVKSHCSALSASAIRGWASSATRSIHWPIAARTKGCISRWAIADLASAWRAISGCGWVKRPRDAKKLPPHSNEYHFRAARFTTAIPGSSRRPSCSTGFAIASGFKLCDGFLISVASGWKPWVEKRNVIVRPWR